MWVAMEAACSPILRTLQFRGPATTTDAGSAPKLFYCVNGNRLRTGPLFIYPRNLIFQKKIENRFRSDRIIANVSAREYTEHIPCQKFAVLLEVDGVLVDVYGLDNCNAFNVAFRKLGLDCANWTEPVYVDLARKCDGDEETMLNLYFNRIGWPTSVATNEKGIFVKNVIRDKKIALDDLVMSEAFLLRPGAKEFINNASKEGIPVVILTSYGTSGEKVARSIAEKLRNEQMFEAKIVGGDEVKQSLRGRLVFGKGASSGLEDGQSIVAALRAGAEYAEVPVEKCVLVAGSHAGVAAAELIGMPCVVLGSSATSRAEFPSTVAVLDGFGGADLTISRLGLTS